MAKKIDGTQASRGPDKMIMRRTLILMAVCGIVAFIVLAGRLYHLQIVKHNDYESMAIGQQLRDTSINADRGTIYDRNMKILAMSASVDTIFISPAEIIKYEEDTSLIAQGLSEILDVDYSSIIEMASDTKSYYKIVARKVEQDLSDKVREFKNEHDLKGIKLEPDSKRYYPYSNLASHIIGFVGQDNVGLGGLESYYNDILMGTSGRVVSAKTSGGSDMLFTKFEDFYDAEDGNDIVLTTDSTIQYYVEKSLTQAVKDFDIQNGAAAIVMDVKTGGILSLANAGGFDLNNFQMISEEAQDYVNEIEDEEERQKAISDAQQLQWRNKALSDTYEPGSTFKIITLAMALEEGLANETDPFYCGGNVSVRGRTSPANCWKLNGHGAQTLVNAVQHSCNVAFVNLGLAVGTQKFYEYAEAFGFFKYNGDPTEYLTGTTGIDLAGESGSIWWPRNVFCNEDNLSQIAAASFGQTLNITPLQLLTAISACTNGGYLMKPYFVDSVLDPDGNLISKTEPTVVRQVLSEETSRKITDILEQVVSDPVHGTGKNAYVAGYRIGGKTGTSTNTVKEAQTGEKEYIVSFVGVAPIEDPQIAILVILDNPGPAGGYASGGNMGAPTVGKMMADILPYLGVEPKYSDEEMETMDKTVPKVTGMSIEEAMGLLSNEGLDSRVIGAGTTITNQLPAPNAVVAAGSQIIIYTDAEPSEGTEIMEDLSGLSYSVARQRLAYSGLFIRTSGTPVTNPNSMIVVNQSIEVGAEVEYGTIVAVELQTYDPSMQGRY